MTNISQEINQLTFESDKHKALLNLMFTNNWILDRLNGFFKTYSITNQQFNVLRILKGQHPKPCTAKYIKEVMIFKAPDLTRLLDRLIEKGFVVRKACKQNRRELDINITKSGIDLLEQLNPLLRQCMEGLIDLTERVAQDLSNLLDKARGQDEP